MDTIGDIITYILAWAGTLIWAAMCYADGDTKGGAMFCALNLVVVMVRRAREKP